MKQTRAKKWKWVHHSRKIKTIYISPQILTFFPQCRIIKHSQWTRKCTKGYKISFSGGGGDENIFKGENK